MIKSANERPRAKHYSGGKKQYSPQRTTQGYRFISQSEAEASKTLLAAAPGDPQAS